MLVEFVSPIASVQLWKLEVPLGHELPNWCKAICCFALCVSLAHVLAACTCCFKEHRPEKSRTVITIPADAKGKRGLISMELRWCEDKTVLGGVRIDGWTKVESPAGATPQDLISTFRAGQTKVGAESTYASKSNYLFFLKTVSGIKPKNTWDAKGRVIVGNTTYRCGYHEVLTEYILLSNKKKRFPIVVTDVKDDKVAEVKFTTDNALVGTGIIRLRIGKPPGKGVYIYPEVTLGGNSTAPAGGQWIAVRAGLHIEYATNLGLK